MSWFGLIQICSNLAEFLKLVHWGLLKKNMWQTKIWVQHFGFPVESSYNFEGFNDPQNVTGG